MAFTEHCDVFASLHETAMNGLVLQLQRQRPSLFNYGTVTFVRHPELLCDQNLLAQVDPEVRSFGNPVVSTMPLLAIPGYSGPFGLEYCLQLTELSVDLHPGNIHVLPPQLSPPLGAQHFSLKGRVCGGIACPGLRTLLEVMPTDKAFDPASSDPVRGKDAPRENPSKDGATANPTRPLPFQEKPLCFCLSLYAVLHLARGSDADPVISLRLDGLELVDVRPDGLESSLECFLKTTLVLGLLPRIKLALSALSFNLGEVIGVTPTPLSASVPFNPAVEDDQVKAFISVTV